MTEEITEKLLTEMAKLELRKEVVTSIEETIREDLILPMLDLVNPATCAEIVGEEFSIGPRDWQWGKHTGESVGCGAWLE